MFLWIFESSRHRCTGQGVVPTVTCTISTDGFMQPSAIHTAANVKGFDRFKNCDELSYKINFLTSTLTMDWTGTLMPEVLTPP